ncbi:MAG: DUF1003 domain-containing protein [Pseudomonadota bacterium]|nr:DUF1003 domain-containing protein [Pseudomonadota bacterium]
MSRTSKVVDFILDYTARTWTAFWLTVGFCVGYALFNDYTNRPFDPYPFVFLTLLITVASYLQNIIVLLFQKRAEEKQQKVEALQAKQLLYILHIMEALQEHFSLALSKSNEAICLESTKKHAMKEES